MKEDTPKESTAKKVFDWIKKRPFIVYALKKDLINFSSLARMIQKELDIKNFDAVIVATRRYQKEIQIISSDKKILEILQKSTLEIKTGTNVYICKNIDKKILERLKTFHLIQGEYLTLITNEKLDMNTIKRWENAVEVKIKSPEDLETIPGIMGYICSSLGEKGINILETYSCYKETFFVFEKKDLTNVVETFENIGIK